MCQVEELAHDVEAGCTTLPCPRSLRPLPAPWLLGEMLALWAQSGWALVGSPGHLEIVVVLPSFSSLDLIARGPELRCMPSNQSTNVAVCVS